MLNVFFLGPLRNPERDGIISARQDRHCESELRLKMPPRSNFKGFVLVCQIGVVSEQLLSEFVIHVKADDRRIDVLVNHALDLKSDRFSTDDPGERATRGICEFRGNDLDLTGTEAFGFLVEPENLQIVPQIGAVDEILPHIGELKMYAGYLRAGGKIVAFSVGERCGDMMIIHIEKALRGVQGAYPTIAQLFAQTFCGDGVKYINREDDSGDAGLRKSKLQYLPLRLVDKYNLAVKRPIDSLSKLPELETERLVLKEVADEDVHEFARLARDDELNRYWGYNWHDDAPETAPDSWFLEDIRNDFKKKKSCGK